ncbi:MAG: hypothetical protein LKF17_08525 [Pediococcus acidilactici]|nr:hypothetical protein [Pediococcus acidilactici]
MTRIFTDGFQVDVMPGGLLKEPHSTGLELAQK